MEKPSYPLRGILINYCRRQNQQIDADKFKLHLLSNPSYPSIKSITDTLDYFSIPNIAAIIPKDSFQELPTSFLASIELDGKKHIASVVVDKTQVRLVVDDGSNQKITTDDFVKIWNGGVILIEPREGGQVKTKLERFGKIIVMFLIFFSLLSSVIYTSSVYGIIFFLTSIIGLLVSYFIVKEEFGMEQELTSKICNSSTINTSCNEVVNSESSKLFGLLSLSDAAATYFIGTTIILSFLGFNASFFLLLTGLSLPLIVYTIYSQAFVVKKWCPLCLAITFMLIAQFAITIFTGNISSIDFRYTYLALLVFGITYFIWINIKSLFVKGISLEEAQQAFYRFKWDNKLFLRLLKEKEVEFPPEIGYRHSVTFGNPNAELVITGVTNPMCGFCSEAFEVYDQLLKTNANNIQLNIVFSVPVDLEYDNAQIAQSVIEIYEKDKQVAYEALKDWYSDRNFERWQKKYGILNEPNDLSTLKHHHNWFNNNDLVFSPTSVVNINVFPEKYDITDLPMFIDLLVDTVGKENKGPFIRKAQ